MKSYLCVGGPCAGQKYDTPRSRFEVPINPKPPLGGGSGVDPVVVKSVTYVEETFHTAQGAITFWVPQGQSWFDTMVLLLEAYESTLAAADEIIRLRSQLPKDEKEKVS